jgi:MFS family permease
VQPAALALVLFAGPLGLSRAAIAACAIAAGLFAPPISSLTRTLWRHRFDRDDERRIAFAADSILVELNFTLGPALVALLLTIGTPGVAFFVAWLFAAAAAPLFLRSPAPRWWKAERGAARHLLGPLTEPRLLLVYATTAAYTFAFGLLEVGYPGVATAQGTPALGGVLIAICSIGSAVGGFAYGGIAWTLPVERQLPRLTAAMVLPVAAHAFVASPWLLAPLAFVAGLLMAPALTAVTLLVTHHAPARYATEAFTWSTACVVASVGAGMAAGGALIQASGPPAAFALATAGVAAASVLGLALRPPAIRVG